MPYDFEKPAGFAYESLTVADSAIGFTAATATNAIRALVTAETAEMRFRYDGTDPTASEGHVIRAYETIALEGPQNISQFRAIRTGGVSGTLKTTFER